jgi:D-glycero-beta-D-manno-heptose-7-phosphate kinase
MIVQQEKYKVLLIGDSCTDVYIFTSEQRKNPECDAPLLTEVGRLAAGGMARNVYKCLKNLEVDVTLITNKVINEKVRIIDNLTGKQILRLDNDPKESDEIKFEDLPDLSQFTHVVISDYDKGFVSRNFIEKLSNYCTSGTIIVDTKKKDIGKYLTAHNAYLKINTEEYNALEPKVGGIVTRGSNGADVMSRRGQRLAHVPALPATEVDVCGAGDSFLAGLVYGDIVTGDIINAIDYAIVNAGISVERYGTYAPTLSELKERMHEFKPNRY